MLLYMFVYVVTVKSDITCSPIFNLSIGTPLQNISDTGETHFLSPHFAYKK